MLKENFFIEATDEIVELYNQYTDSIIKKMAYEIKALGKLDNIERQAKMVLSANGVYDDMVAKLSKLTRYSKKEIESLLKKTGVTTLSYDDKIYRKAGFEPAPINQSPTMLQILASNAKLTNYHLENLVRTSALATSENFYNVLNNAEMQVATGALDYDRAIAQAIKQLAADGTIIKYPTGVSTQLENMVRRAVLTSVKSTANSLQETRADEFEAPYADTSAHSGARPTHAEWQGKRFCRYGSKEKGTGKYPNFYEDNFGKENKPVFQQLNDPNCRHSWYPVMDDEEPMAYTQERIDDMNNRIVVYNGKEYSYYEAEQRMRQMERNVRKYKREANALEIIGQDNSFEKAKAAKWENMIIDFAEKTDVARRKFNEKVFY